MSKYSFWHQSVEITDQLLKHPESLNDPQLRRLVRAAWLGLNVRGYGFYRAKIYEGDVVIFQAQEKSPVVREKWEQAVKGNLHFHKTGGDHGNHILMPYARDIAAILREYLIPR